MARKQTPKKEAVEDVQDVVIVGGGVSGLYSAWRILTGVRKGGPLKKVTVLEQSARTGGRLLTWYPFPEDKALHGELGGMRFFAKQSLVWGLIVDYFVKTKHKLKPPVKFFVDDPNGNNLWYLREKLLKAQDLVNPDKVPYLLDSASRNAGPGPIIAGVIGWLLVANRPAIAKLLGGKTRPDTWEEWDTVKPHLEYNGRKLWNIGFWNLLADLLSPEGYAFVTDSFGYYSITNNWNAAEAMQSIYLDFTQNPDYQTLDEGYAYLPYLLKEEVRAAGGEVLLDSPVEQIERRTNGVYEVKVKGIKGKPDQTFLARQVILAMPRRSLELLRETPLWRMDRVVGNVGGKPVTLGDYVKSVIPYPAFKMFLAYEDPWWRTPPVSIAAGRSVCDMPIRQTYYFPPVPDPFPPPKPNSPLLKGPALLMATYDDARAVGFWEMLENPDAEKAANKQLMRQAVAAKKQVLGATGTAPSGLQAYVQETNDALVEEPGFYYAPSEMIRHAQQQLQLLHFNKALPDPMPNPHAEPGNFLAAYMDWGHDPYGGGWNFWAPNVDVKYVMENMRRPLPGENVYVAGEAYSGNQGWVEGALTTTEKMLREYFHLERASWQPKDAYLGY